MNARRPRVAVVYNEPVLPAGHPDAASEADVVAVAGSVAGALNGSGFEALTVAAGPPLGGFVVRLAGLAPDFVFNLVEGFAGSAEGEVHLTSVFELLGFPYTGSPVEALAACVSKARTKALLRGHGLPTAASVVVHPGEPVEGLGRTGPVLVKPDAEDGSWGIDQGSVVSDPSALDARVARLRHEYGGSVLVEAYLPGPEYNVGVIALPGAVPLPVAQVVFTPAAGAWPILTYGAKWDEGSAADLGSRVVCPAPIEASLRDRLGALAVSAFRATGCRDYARVDLRLDDRGEPMILEVNPNPDLGPGAGWARAARAAGWDYAGAVVAIARQALGRAGAGRHGPTGNHRGDLSSTSPL